MSFSFQGSIQASKSMMNRALLLKSFEPSLEINGNSACEDVRNMKSAIASFLRKEPIFCGEAGTVLRFMAIRASRVPGIWKLTGHPRLFSRPQQEIVFILNQLGVTCQLLSDAIVIHSEGWKKPLVPIRVNREQSSQFASGLLLSGWNLPFDLQFEMKSGVSEGYWNMTLEMARKCGLDLKKSDSFWTIERQQKISSNGMTIEPDYSSVFAVAAAAVLAGNAEIQNMTASSLQPDFSFISILKKMGAKSDLTNDSLKIEKPEHLSPIDADLKNSPDLFPVLSVLCGFAKGTSRLTGAPHLIHKESDRVLKTAELLKLAGISVKSLEGGLEIVGQGSEFKPSVFRFDPDQDHRMAMAAGLLRLKGYQIDIQDAHVVNKSFPEFWSILEGRP